MTSNTRWSTAVEKKHPNHGTRAGRKQFSKRCRKCVLGDDYGIQ